MKIQLSCVRCGSTEFNHEPIQCIKVEGNYYLLHEDIKDNEVTCAKCGLRDYVANLVIVFK
ncbi:hypothetical protein [Clostridium botulinum]|uniref:Uncharacterized protein n=1 Tax=Clostridium botulinum B2 450 TaxID=1379739 RepID=A0A0D0ZS79_CLOBO|nr:hypothetical protein [Clostridium botulinum]KEI84039.1 hypothetical protein N493_19235 [Clostridium botulinum B2 433]KIS21698.1 hypothetical protein N495_20095 [Clostridium botulinum B2 450]NFF13774.1 hypothetical protein [Clostridium botulinum]HCL4466738.1 hypothetical protein [Clostridium botulinum]